MKSETNHLDINLLGKEYRVACPPNEYEALLAAVAYVDTKMHDIAEKTKSNISERIAVMAALNIAHEFLALSAKKTAAPEALLLGQTSELGVDFALAKRRISHMEAQLDAILVTQEKLF